jgi:hypothetical protein
MSDNAQLRDQMWAALEKTTITGNAWVQRGRPNSGYWGQAHALVEQIAAPPSVATSGFALYVLGGQLAGCAHLADGTYDVLIGDWDEAATLAKAAAAEKYAYTVVSRTPARIRRPTTCSTRPAPTSRSPRTSPGASSSSRSTPG